MLIQSSPRPAVLLFGSDRDWALSLAGAIHELDSETTLRNFVEMLAAKFVLEGDPSLGGEELEERVNEELYERAERSRSLSHLEDLVSMICDVDPDFETEMFGDTSDRLETLLASSEQIKKSAFHALNGLTSYIHTYPERIQAEVDEFLKPTEAWMDEDQVQEWRENEMAELMLGRRNAIIAGLIEHCIDPAKKYERRRSSPD